MSDDEDWEFPESARPSPEDVDFDLDRALSAVVSLRAKIIEDGFTAPLLGTERAGNGVVIGEDGLVLTADIINDTLAGASACRAVGNVLRCCGIRSAEASSEATDGSVISRIGSIGVQWLSSDACRIRATLPHQPKLGRLHPLSLGLN